MFQNNLKQYKCFTFLFDNHLLPMLEVNGGKEEHSLSYKHIQLKLTVVTQLSSGLGSDIKDQGLLGRIVC